MLIAIRLPDSLEKRVLSFPFLHAIRKLYTKNEEDSEKLELHLITKEEGIEVLYLLPFNAFYHPLQEEDNQSALNIYRAYKSLKINKRVDVFYDLNLNFFDSLLGIFFMAKKRVGFSKGNAQYLYSVKIPFFEGIHLKENYLKLLQEEDSQTRLVSREMEPLDELASTNPYIVFNLDINKEGEIVEDWYEFLSFFEEKKIILTCDALPVGEQAYVLQGFMSKLPEHSNQIEVFQIDNSIEFARLISYATLFLSYNSPLTYISAYCGTHTFLLNLLPNIQEMAPLDFLGKVRIFSDRDPSYMKGLRFDLGKVFDEVDQILLK